MHGLRGFRTLDPEMVVEEALMQVMLMKMMRRQHHREDRHLGRELHLHQPADHRLGDELMAIDAAVDDEAGGDDRVIAPAARQLLRMQRDLEGARRGEDVDGRARYAERSDLVEETAMRLADD